MSFEIQENLSGPVPTLEPIGEVDVFTAPQLKAAVEKVLANAHTLAFRLSRTHYMDSTGLAVLIFALKRCRQSGGNCLLIAPHPNILKLLKITGLDRAFTIQPSLEEPHEETH